MHPKVVGGSGGGLTASWSAVASPTRHRFGTHDAGESLHAPSSARKRRRRFTLPAQSKCRASLALPTTSGCTGPVRDRTSFPQKRVNLLASSPARLIREG